MPPRLGVGIAMLLLEPLEDKLESLDELDEGSGSGAPLVRIPGGESSDSLESDKEDFSSTTISEGTADTARSFESVVFPCAPTVINSMIYIDSPIK